MDSTSSPVRKYTIICVVLVVITAIEYFIFKIDSVRDNALIMYPVLGMLSLIKLVYVVGSYMHLASEPKFLKLIFIATVFLCLLIFTILYLTGSMDVPPVNYGT